MKKLIRDAKIKYQICNLVRHKASGVLKPSSVKKHGTIEKITTAANIKEANTGPIVSSIAKKHNKKRDEVEIKILSITFGNYEHWSHDVY
jgi:hypothetical protein|tara:strand:- start:402 stop:671 length:270 start_codon:yes stop_codon:yes gene_type:complete